MPLVSGGVPTRQRGAPKRPAVLGWVAAVFGRFLQFAVEPKFRIIHQTNVVARTILPTNTFLHNLGKKRNNPITGIEKIIAGLNLHASAKRKCINACNPRNVPHPGHCNPVST